jgi:hypothetical protein
MSASEATTREGANVVADISKELLAQLPAHVVNRGCSGVVGRRLTGHRIPDEDVLVVVCRRDDDVTTVGQAPRLLPP